MVTRAHAITGGRTVPQTPVMISTMDSTVFSRFPEGLPILCPPRVSIGIVDCVVSLSSVLLLVRGLGTPLLLLDDENDDENEDHGLLTFGTVR